jgi:hypothetical protein
VPVVPRDVMSILITLSESEHVRGTDLHSHSSDASIDAGAILGMTASTRPSVTLRVAHALLHGVLRLAVWVVGGGKRWSGNNGTIVIRWDDGHFYLQTADKAGVVKQGILARRSFDPSGRFILIRDTSSRAGQHTGLMSRHEPSSPSYRVLDGLKSRG